MLKLLPMVVSVLVLVAQPGMPTAPGKALSMQHSVAYGAAALEMPSADQQSAPRLPEVLGPQAQTVQRGQVASRVVHLSFDAGADRGHAESILNTLAAEGITASFGMTGLWAQTNSDLVRRMVDEGHRLINHSWSHPSFTGRSDQRPRPGDAQIVEQLERLDALVVDITGQSTKPFFRPPFGDYDARALEVAFAAGYAFNMMWTVDSGGWRRIPASEIVARCLRQTEPGAIILMHVGGDSQDGPALPALIAALRGQGYGFISLPDLLAAPS